MNSKVMIVLAALMLIGAIIAGYLGYKASAQQAKPAVAAATDVGKSLTNDPNHPSSADGRYAVVVAAHDLPAQTPIRNEDVYVDYLRQVPPGSFGKLDAVVGKRPWVTVAAGSVVGEAALQEGGQLSKLIKPGERAVAVAVDEVVGAGGLVRPGDFVDVLLYTKDESNGYQGARHNDASQLVLPGLRVLSYGPRVAKSGEGEKPADQNSQDQQQKAQQENNVQAKTAVLAVAEPDVTKLLLASNLGVLRLAVRSLDEAAPPPAVDKQGKPEPTTLPPDQRGLIMASNLEPFAPAPVSHAVVHAHKAARAAPAEEKSSITVYHGKDAQTVSQ